ncbi:MAG: hypothetical protein KIS80_02865 [Anaerolineales bacterium]|nr:hypothetical protein [Anaerolineales bacterium]
MHQLGRFEAIDYLVVGHITIDQTALGPRLGGSAAYAALTAKAFGWRPGILTAWGEELSLGPLVDIPILNLGAERSSTFENIYTATGDRAQRYLPSLGPQLDFHFIPEAWRAPRILHLAPVAQEVSARILSYFDDSFLGVTPQGWLRGWGPDGQVHRAEWEEAEHVLARADACVLAREDLGGDQAQIERLAAACPLLVVTDGAAAVHIYTQGEQLSVQPAVAEALDPTGAGDVFAAAFFISMYQQADPLQATRLASQLATRSVNHHGLAGAPSRDDVVDLLSSGLTEAF